MTTPLTTSTPDANGRTALHYAVQDVPVNAAQEAIQRALQLPGLDVNHQDKDGNTALHILMATQHESKEGLYSILGFLLDNAKGIDVSLFNHKGLAPILIGAENPCSSRFAQSRLLYHKTFNGRGFHPETGNTILHYAATCINYDKDDVIHIMSRDRIEKELYRANHQGDTPLHLLLLNRPLADIYYRGLHLVAQKLIEEGPADLGLRPNKNGVKPVDFLDFLASQERFGEFERTPAWCNLNVWQYTDRLEVIMDILASLLPPIEQKTAKPIYAKVYGKLLCRTVADFEFYGNDVDLDDWESIEVFERVVNELMWRKGANLNYAEERTGMTFLHHFFNRWRSHEEKDQYLGGRFVTPFEDCAAIVEHPFFEATLEPAALIRLFQTETYLDINLHATTTEGLNLLHFAARLGYLEAAKLLVSERLDINATDNEGRTPLHHASCEEGLRCIDRDSSDDSYSDDSEAIIDPAEMVEWLLQSGSNVLAVTRATDVTPSRTAWEIAVAVGNERIQSKLQEYDLVAPSIKRAVRTTMNSGTGKPSLISRLLERMHRSGPVGVAVARELLPIQDEKWRRW